MDTISYSTICKNSCDLFVLLDVHPDSICEKLGSKYASVPVEELKNHSDFFEDLLRYMTKRLSDV